MNQQFLNSLSDALAAIRILPRRMLLDTPGVAATVPMLRGVWGAALHDLEPEVYARVFAPNQEAGAGANGRSAAPSPAHRPTATQWNRSQASGIRDRRTPAVMASGTAVACYILRPAPPDPEFAPAVDWLLIGPAVTQDATLCRAWDVASGMGLGPQRRRFHLRRTVGLHPEGKLAEPASAWPLNESRWWGCAAKNSRSTAPHGMAVLPPDQPCRLVFPSPLRLIHRKRLIQSPTLADVVVAACRRVQAYLPVEHQAAWEPIRRQALEQARRTPTGRWQGQRLDLHRYSASQRADLELRGVTGFLPLPRGPGELWPLLAAARWLHLGKGTVMGMGQMEVEKMGH